ncbi:MAG: hypothetical protein WD603_00320 [Patescibacteria group bacterium]
MNRKRLILMLVIFAILVTGVLLVLTAGRAAPGATSEPTAPPSPTPTADPLAADRELLARLSTELAVKYQSFSRADAAYAESIRPYLTKEFYEDYRSTLRYADRAPFFQPVRSEALRTDVTGDSAAGEAQAEVRLRSTLLRTEETFEQTIEITWQRFGSRWSATDVHISDYDREGYDG